MNPKCNVLEWKIIIVCVFPHLEGPSRTPAHIEYLQYMEENVKRLNRIDVVLHLVVAE